MLVYTKAFKSQSGKDFLMKDKTYKIRQAGNSLVVTIPPFLLNELGLSEGDSVVFSKIKKGEYKIQPAIDYCVDIKIDESYPIKKDPKTNNWIGLPKKSYAVNHINNTLDLITRGEIGYKETLIPSERFYVENKKLNVTPIQALAMKQGSMYGFENRIAAPGMYTYDDKFNITTLEKEVPIKELLSNAK